MRPVRALAMAAVAAALSQPAWAQRPNCRPTPDARDWLAANGWAYHDALVAPSGVAFTLYCRGETGLLIGHPPDAGASCLITVFPRGCMTVPPRGTES